MAVLLESALYDAKDPSRIPWWKRCFRRKKHSSGDVAHQPPPNTAISIRNLRKTFKSPWWSYKKSEVEAVADLTLDIPRNGIFVLLGSNGYVVSKAWVWLG